MCEVEENGGENISDCDFEGYSAEGMPVNGQLYGVNLDEYRIVR